jgi:hypothetical protein
MGLLAAAASGFFRNPPQKDLENHLDEDLGGLLVDGERACRNVLLGVLASLDKLEREKISQRIRGVSKEATGTSFAGRSNQRYAFSVLCV